MAIQKPRVRPVAPSQPAHLAGLSVEILQTETRQPQVRAERSAELKRRVRDIHRRFEHDFKYLAER